MVDNITFKSYLALEDKAEYDFLIMFSGLFNKPEDIFCFGDLTNQSFGFIKELQQDFNKGLTWERFFYHIKKPIDQLLEYGLMELCQARSYFKSEIERINKVESEILASETTEDEIRSGIEKFSVFGPYTQLRSIAITFGKLPREIESMKYSDALLELYYQKLSFEYQSTLREIRTSRNN